MACIIFLYCSSYYLMNSLKLSINYRIIKSNYKNDYSSHGRESGMVETTILHPAISLSES